MAHSQHEPQLCFSVNMSSHTCPDIVVAFFNLINPSATGLAATTFPPVTAQSTEHHGDVAVKDFVGWPVVVKPTSVTEGGILLAEDDVRHPV